MKNIKLFDIIFYLGIALCLIGFVLGAINLNSRLGACSKRGMNSIAVRATVLCEDPNTHQIYGPS